MLAGPPDVNRPSPSSTAAAPSTSGRAVLACDPSARVDLRAKVLDARPNGRCAQNNAMQRARDDVRRHGWSLCREPLIATVILHTGVYMPHCLPFACGAVVGLSLLITSFGAAGDPPQAVSDKTDECPSGIATPEGVAADMVRAFIDRDSRLFNNARHKRMCEGRDNPAKYFAAFLENASFAHNSKMFNIDTLPNPLKRISTVYVTRSMAPQDADAEAAWKQSLRFDSKDDRMFVDVVAVDSDGTAFAHRIVVEKHVGGAWFAVPPLSTPHWHSEALKAYSPSSDVFWTESTSTQNVAK